MLMPWACSICQAHMHLYRSVNINKSTVHDAMAILKNKCGIKAKRKLGKKKKTPTTRGRPHQLITATQLQKKKRSQYTKPTYVVCSVHLFRDLNQVNVHVHACVCVCVCVCVCGHAFVCQYRVPGCAKVRACMFLHRHRAAEKEKERQRERERERKRERERQREREETEGLGTSCPTHTSTHACLPRNPKHGCSDRLLLLREQSSVCWITLPSWKSTSFWPLGNGNASSCDQLDAKTSDEGKSHRQIPFEGGLCAYTNKKSDQWLTEV